MFETCLNCVQAVPKKKKKFIYFYFYWVHILYGYLAKPGLSMHPKSKSKYVWLKYDKHMEAMKATKFHYLRVKHMLHVTE